MPRMARTICVTTAIGLGLLLLCACATPPRGAVAGNAPPDATPEQPAGAADVQAVASAPTTQAAPTSTEKEAEDAKQEAKKARERERKREKLQQSLEVAQLNLAKAQISVELGELKYHDALSQAEMEFELAKKREQIFKKFTAPNRIARAELSLKQAEDGVTETQEELYQLEQMYKEEQFADQTKEIVLERARRRLERAQRDLELQREEFQTLKEISLPLEQQEVEHAAELKQRAVLQVQRDNEPGIIDRKVGVLSAEAEVTRIEQELEDVLEEIAEAAQKRTP